MSDQQLRNEMITLLLAGHETTANALTWTWYLLSRIRGCAPIRAEVALVLEASADFADLATDLYHQGLPRSDATLSADLDHGAPRAHGRYHGRLSHSRGIDCRALPLCHPSHPAFWIIRTFRSGSLSPGATRTRAGSLLPLGVGQRLCIGSNLR